MPKFLSALALVAAIAAPAALHATPISGQFSIDGTVTNNGTTLTFLPGNHQDWHRHTTRYLQASRSR